MVFSNRYLLLSLSSLNSRLSDHQKSDFCISIKIIITWPLHEIWGTIIVWWAINTIERRKGYYESNSNSAFAKCGSLLFCWVCAYFYNQLIYKYKLTNSVSLYIPLIYSTFALIHHTFNFQRHTIKSIILNNQSSCFM